MESTTLSTTAHFGAALVFLIAGFFFVTAGVVLAKLLAPRNPYTDKLSNYECGEEPIGSPWIRFNIRYYVIALLFIIFDVEILFIIPWAVEYRNLIPQIGFLAFAEMLIFLSILGIGLAYCWVKGHLQWVLPILPNRSPKHGPIA